MGIVDLQSLGVHLVMLAIVVRLLIPAVALASETIYDRFLNVQYEEATQTLMHINDELKQVDPTTANDDTAPPTAGKLAKVRRWLAETQKWFDLREKIDNLGAKLEHFTTDTVRLMVVFILQTIIIPLFTLWALVKLTTIWRVPPIKRKARHPPGRFRITSLPLPPFRVSHGGLAAYDFVVIALQIEGEMVQ